MDTGTPITDHALSHQGSHINDVIVRLEALIEVSRRLERDREALTTALAALWGIAADVPSVKNRPQLAQMVRAALAMVSDGR